MKIKTLLLMFVIGFLSLVSATAPPDHKVPWCHYPPGGWNGTPQNSHAIILSIDLSGEGGGPSKDLTAHLGHSPSLPGGVCNPPSFNGVTADHCAEGVTTTGDATGCPGLGCPIIHDFQGGPGNTPADIQLVGTPPNCVCPSGSLMGMPPVSDGMGGQTCGAHG